MKSPALPLALLFALPSGVAHAAPAEPEDRPSSSVPDARARAPLHVGVAARTDVPLFVGVQATLEHSATRLRLTAAAGVLPAAYGRMLNGVASSAGAYDSRVASTLAEGMGNGFAWNVHAGFRPIARHGLLLEIGYASATLASEGDARALVPAASNIDASFRYASHFDLVDARVGWEWIIAGHGVVQLAGGLSRVVGSSTTFEPPALASNALGSSTSDVDSAFRRYGYVPTASLAVGYRF